MVRRDYQKEILECLTKNDGCVVGVRELQRIGNFNPNPLREHLKKMSKLRLIRITGEKDRRKICIIDLEFEKEFKKNTKSLEHIETQLYRPDLTEDEKFLLIGNYLKIAIHQYQNYDVSLLYAQCIQSDSKRTQVIKIVKDTLWDNMNKILLKLDGIARTRIVNSLFSVLEKPPSLKEYRIRKYIPTRKEILTQRKLEKKQIQNDYEKFQKYCQICGDKNSSSYKEGAKHRQKHGEQLYAIIKHGGWHCQYCGDKLPLDQKKARKHQNTHRII